MHLGARSIALYEAAQALRTRFILNCQPEDLHFADDNANLRFQLSFACGDLRWSRRSLAPTRNSDPRVARCDSKAYELSED